MPTKRLIAFSFALCVGVTYLSTALEAEGQEVSQAQKDAFVEAQASFDAKDYATALQGFQALLTETGSPNARLYVARSLRELGRIAEAYDEMAATVREARERAEAEPKYVGTRDAAAAELALLEAQVGHVMIALADAPRGVSVKLDGEPVKADRLGRPLTVMPGSHEIVVAGPGVETETRPIELTGGETKSVAFALSPVVTQVEPPVAESPASTGGEVRIVGIVLASLGAASLGAFGATYALADDRFSTLERECPSAQCAVPKYADVVDEGKALERASIATLVAGAALLVAAVPMVIVGGPSDTWTTVALAPTTNGATLVVSGTF